MKSGKVLNLVVTGMCIALGVVLPMAFHSIPNAGSIFLPMHIPVLICGLLCGWQYGLICGILAPALSSILTGMPPMGYLPKMLCELAVYGLIAGVCINHILVKGRQIVNLYLSLIIAMICGRVISGVLNAFLFSAGSYTMKAFIAGSFITCIPGIVIQLVVIPILVYAVQKSGVITKVRMA